MKDEKIIVIENDNGEKIVFSRYSETMISVIKILAIVNLVMCVISVFFREYLVSLFDAVVSFFVWEQSLHIERNNEIFDFFANNNGGEND